MGFSGAERVRSAPLKAGNPTDMKRRTAAERGERKRLAAEEGEKALAEYAAHDIAVRNNMMRLRALRAASEAQTAPALAPSSHKFGRYPNGKPS